MQPTSGESFPQIDRRREPRSRRIRLCVYNLMTRSSVNPDVLGVALEEGRGMAMDESQTGIGLLLRVAPEEGQILEIQSTYTPLGPTISLVEVCWTKLLVRDEEDRVYFVGCRVNFRTHVHSDNLAPSPVGRAT